MAPEKPKVDGMKAMNRKALQRVVRLALGRTAGQRAARARLWLKNSDVKEACNALCSVQPPEGANLFGLGVGCAAYDGLPPWCPHLPNTAERA